MPVEPLKVNQSEELEVGVRPEDLMLSETGKGLPLKVDVLERLGGSTLVYGSLEKYPNFCAMLQGDANVREGELVNLDVKPASFHVFDSNGNDFLDAYDEFVKGYFDIDIAGSKQINKSLTINIGIDNILDYTDPSNITNLPGRIVYGKFNLKL